MAKRLDNRMIDRIVLYHFIAGTHLFGFISGLFNYKVSQFGGHTCMPSIVSIEYLPKQTIGMDYLGHRGLYQGESRIKI